MTVIDLRPRLLSRLAPGWSAIEVTDWVEHTPDEQILRKVVCTTCWVTFEHRMSTADMAELWPEVAPGAPSPSCRWHKYLWQRSP